MYFFYSINIDKVTYFSYLLNDLFSSIMQIWQLFLIFRLPPEFLPVSGPSTRWCAFTLAATLLYSSRAGAYVWNQIRRIYSSPFRQGRIRTRDHPLGWERADALTHSTMVPANFCLSYKFELKRYCNLEYVCLWLKYRP